MERKSQHGVQTKLDRLSNMVVASSTSRTYFVWRHRNWQASSSCIACMYVYIYIFMIHSDKLHQVTPSDHTSSHGLFDRPPSAWARVVLQLTYQVLSSLPRMRSKEKVKVDTSRYAVTLDRRWSKHHRTSKYNVKMYAYKDYKETWPQASHGETKRKASVQSRPVGFKRQNPILFWWSKRSLKKSFLWPIERPPLRSKEVEVARKNAPD